MNQLLRYLRAAAPAEAPDRELLAFQGKTLRVTGKVEPMEDPAKKGPDYRLVISELENLEVVK